MAVVLIDGFDKYGGVNSNSSSITSLIASGEWTSFTATACQIVAPLSATGQALQLGSSGNLLKSLPNYTRIIGGMRFSITVAGTSSLVNFRDSATAQCTIAVDSSNIITVRNGNAAGTILGTGSSVTTGSTHYLEWDITIGNSAAYQVWLDGVSIISGTGDTQNTVNAFANGFGSVAGSGTGLVIDDLYLFDTTGATNNVVLLTSPRIETTFPTSDSAVQFAFGAGILGSSVAKVATANSLTAGRLWLRRFTPTANCTLNSISVVPAFTSGVANFRPVVYADSAGAAGTLLSAGSTVTGVTSGVVLTMPLTTPQSLTAGTQYWLGLMNDTAGNCQQLDGSASAYVATVTFASGAPGTAPAMTSGQASWLLWGNLTGMAVNYDEVNNQPPDGQYSYVYDSTVNHEDLYNFNAFSQPPVTIHTVAVKAYAQKSDSGTKTVSMRLKSGATDSGGSNTGQALGTTFGWLGSFFSTDPNTSAAWTASALNAATSGLKIDS